MRGGMLTQVSGRGASLPSPLPVRRRATQELLLGSVPPKEVGHTVPAQMGVRWDERAA